MDGEESVIGAVTCQHEKIGQKKAESPWGKKSSNLCGMASSLGGEVSRYGKGAEGQHERAQKNQWGHEAGGGGPDEGPHGEDHPDETEGAPGSYFPIAVAVSIFVAQGFHGKGFEEGDDWPKEYGIDHGNGEHGKKGVGEEIASPSDTTEATGGDENGSP